MGNFDANILVLLVSFKQKNSLEDKLIMCSLVYSCFHKRLSHMSVVKHMHQCGLVLWVAIVRAAEFLQWQEHLLLLLVACFLMESNCFLPLILIEDTQWNIFDSILWWSSPLFAKQSCLTSVKHVIVSALWAKLTWRQLGIYLFCFLMLTLSEIQNETVVNVNVQEAEEVERVVWDLLVLGEREVICPKTFLLVVVFSELSLDSPSKISGSAPVQNMLWKIYKGI